MQFIHKCNRTASGRAGKNISCEIHILIRRVNISLYFWKLNAVFCNLIPIRTHQRSRHTAAFFQQIFTQKILQRCNRGSSPSNIHNQNIFVFSDHLWKIFLCRFSVFYILILNLSGIAEYKIVQTLFVYCAWKLVSVKIVFFQFVNQISITAFRQNRLQRLTVPIQFQISKDIPTLQIIQIVLRCNLKKR